MDELKSCPFCGNAPEWNLGQKGDGTPWRYLACSECEAMGPHVADWELSQTAPDKDEVNDAIIVAAWNRRTPAANSYPLLVEALTKIRDFPPMDYPRRDEDGYPSEIVYDAFAYRRIVDTFRDFARAALAQDTRP